MATEGKRGSIAITLKRKVNRICKNCGEAVDTSSESSSTASSKACLPFPKRTKINKMTSSGAGPSGRAESARWSSNVEYEFVDVMYDEALRGNIYTTTFTPMVWSDIRNKLFERTGVMFSPKQLKGKHNRLKDIWRRYSELMVAMTGIGWNAETNLPQAEPEIWEALGQRNKDFLELRYKSFPHFVKLDVVFSGRAATGAAARASTQPPVHPGQGRSENAYGSTDLRSPGFSTPGDTHTRSTTSGSRKRKATEDDLYAALVNRLTATTDVIAAKDAKKEEWSIDKVLEVLNLIHDLDEHTFNLCLTHFRSETNRRLFMGLTPTQQRSYIRHNFEN